MRVWFCIQLMLEIFITFDFQVGGVFSWQLINNPSVLGVKSRNQDARSYYFQQNLKRILLMSRHDIFGHLPKPCPLWYNRNQINCHMALAHSKRVCRGVVSHDLRPSLRTAAVRHVDQGLSRRRLNVRSQGAQPVITNTSQGDI